MGGGRSHILDDRTQLLSFLTLLAYPAMDLLVIGALIRVFSTPGRASGALRFLFLALVVQLLVDGAYAATALSYEIGTPLDTGWMLAYVLFGAAALCPSPAPGPPAAVDDALLGRRRLLLVGSATLLGPAGLLVAAILDGFDRALARPSARRPARVAAARPRPPRGRQGRRPRARRPQRNRHGARELPRAAPGRLVAHPRGPRVERARRPARRRRAAQRT